MTSSSLLAPDHIVVVGASDDAANIGGRFVRALRVADFDGEVSVVHPRAESVAGYRVYRDLSELPSRPDHVIVAVAGERVVSVVGEAARAGARTIHVFAGGFGEAADPDGMRRQADLVAAIDGTDARLIGPNCMGVHRPSAGITFREDLPLRCGPLGVVAQSGGIAIAAIRLADTRRVGVSTVLSYGNASDFGAADGVTLLAEDPDTKVIAVYLESANDDRLLNALHDAVGRKPVVVWPCGTDEISLRAARYHTGAPGGLLDRASLPSACRIVDRLQDLVDVPAALLLKRGWPPDPAVAFISISGGFAVGFAAMTAREQLRMPPLEAATGDRLLGLYGPDVGNLANPVDLGGPGYLSRGRLASLFGAVGADPEIDVIVFHLAWDFIVEAETRVPGYGDAYLGALSAAVASSPKPVVVYSPALELSPGELSARQTMRDAGCLVLEDSESVARVLRASSSDPHNCT